MSLPLFLGVLKKFIVDSYYVSFLFFLPASLGVHSTQYSKSKGEFCFLTVVNGLYDHIFVGFFFLALLTLNFIELNCEILSQNFFFLH